MIGISTRKSNLNVKARLSNAESRAGIPRSAIASDSILALDEFLRFGKESRAQSVGTDTAGGYLAPQEFSEKLYVMLKAVDPLWDPEVTTQVETKTGGPFAIPILDDTSGTATIIPENQISLIEDIGPFDQIVLPKAPTWRSPLVKVSIELMADSAYDIEEMLAQAFAIRFQRGIGQSLVTVLSNSAGLGVTAAQAAITIDNLQDLYESVDPEYLKSKKFGWLMNHATLIAIRKLETGPGQRIIPTFRDPETGHPLLLALPVYISPSVAPIGTGNRSIFLGDLGSLIVRRVADSVRIRRLGERFMDELAIGFTASMRVNAALAKAAGADAPVKYLIHS
jgi:HK97 family phage major capsid protein